MTLIDLHCHTQPRSACSSLTAEALIALARERGLDGICLTEHDRVWPETELCRLREATGFLVLGAIELTTDLGHVLAFGLDTFEAGFAMAANVFAAAERAGALLYLAHPARDGMLRLTPDVLRYFASVETQNGSDTRLQNVSAGGLAASFRLPGIGGSDCHSPREAARAATRFHVPVVDNATLLEALHSGAYEAVALG